MSVVATIGHGTTAFWYLTRGTGLVALVLLSASVVIGIVASNGVATERWPRFATQRLHRSASLLCIMFVSVHVVTTVADGYVPIDLLDAVVPFRTPYRPVWVGLGATAFDLLLAVAATSILRFRIGVRAWRGVHWLAYACWPIALLHALGSGSDARVPVAQAIFLCCVAGVLGAVAWRLAAARHLGARLRAAAGAAAVAVVLAIGAFAVVGPLRPGWSARAGTSPSVLAALARARTAGTVPAGRSGGTTTTTTTTVPEVGRRSTSPAVGSGSSSIAGSGTRAGSVAAVPTASFTDTVAGSVTQQPLADGNVVVDLRLHLVRRHTTFVIRLIGTPEGSGVAMTASQVTLGADRGTVTALDGTQLTATVSGPSGTLQLSMTISIDGASHTVAGSVRGVAG